MVDSCYSRELEDVVHRLLPPEIFADIGIVVDGRRPSSGAVSGSQHAVVEELAARLAGILGLGGTREQHALQSRRGVMNGSGALVGAISGGHHRGMARHGPGSWNGAVQRSLPRFEPAAPFDVASYHHPPARCRRGGGGGTGVFLPSAEVHQLNSAVSSTSPSPRNGAKPPRMLRKEAAAMQQRQQQLLQLRAMAAEMEEQKREAFAAAFQDCMPAFALRQQWMY